MSYIFITHKLQARRDEGGRGEGEGRRRGGREKGRRREGKGRKGGGKGEEQNYIWVVLNQP